MESGLENEQKGCKVNYLEYINKFLSSESFFKVYTFPNLLPIIIWTKNIIHQLSTSFITSSAASLWCGSHFRSFSISWNIFSSYSYSSFKLIFWHSIYKSLCSNSLELYKTLRQGSCLAFFWIPSSSSCFLFS